MCGIVGAVAQREVSGILLEGLHRLEYRGYDSAGLALVGDNELHLCKEEGKVALLEQSVVRDGLSGHCGIAHTRWATHGKPSRPNAHPHRSGPYALVHNGIIENHAELRAELVSKGFRFDSETDSEVIAHLFHDEMTRSGDKLQALANTLAKLHGAYGLAIVAANEPDEILCARSGSPLVIGIGIGEHFVASDQLALRQVTDRFVYLEEGDMARVSSKAFQVYDAGGQPVQRQQTTLADAAMQADKGDYRHFMLKEIYEQPAVIADTLRGRIYGDRLLEESFGAEAGAIFDRARRVQIVACGTSYHAGLVAKYWFEAIAGIPCQVEIASEFRYRKAVVEDNTLLVTISQSGETADTLAALRLASEAGFFASLAVCNVPQSTLVRESDICLMTQAGPEIGVASTKAFTTQLTVLLMLVIALGRRGGMTAATEQAIVQALCSLPDKLAACLELDPEIAALAEEFADRHGALFLGRGTLWPIAMEGALKLKEISYIHAESYAAGELKHGPLALVDADMPVIAVAPNNQLLEKLKSNLHEVQARGGQLYVFADKEAGFANEDGVTVIPLPHVDEVIEPIIYTAPLQLLSYHVAVFKGTDVDQPRNLAKSVTVE